METYLKIVILFLAATSIFGAPQSLAEKEETSNESLNLVTKSMRDFNKELYRKVAEVENGNFVFSPFSLHLALSILALGAPDGSATRAELVSKYKLYYSF